MPRAKVGLEPLHSKVPLGNFSLSGVRTQDQEVAGNCRVPLGDFSLSGPGSGRNRPIQLPALKSCTEKPRRHVMLM